jgi:hypothetical protein
VTGKKRQVAVVRALDVVGAIHRLQIVHAFTNLVRSGIWERNRYITFCSHHKPTQRMQRSKPMQNRTATPINTANAHRKHANAQPNPINAQPTQPTHAQRNQLSQWCGFSAQLPAARLSSSCPLLRAPRYPSRAEDFLLGRSIGSAAVRNNGDGDDDEQQNDDDDDDDDDDDNKGRHRKHGVGNGHDRAIFSNQRESGPADVSPGSSPIAAPSSPPSPPRDVGVRATSGRLPLDDDDDDDAGHQSEGIGSGHADQRSPSSLPRESTRGEQPDSSPIAAAAYDDDDDDDDYYKSKDTTAGPEAGAPAVAAQYPTQTAGQLLRQQLDKPVPKRRRASADDLDADIFGSALQLGNGAEAPSADKGREVGRTLE